ncbi:putative Mra1-like protein [Encephalitozoon intestinalis ATCC 50506]|uniref:Mra1-like protein n=1 Tax=Encephalitozoon intestinalis (strain ATCC 50506) TaxID=876142 RepID=E0S5B3_ENCIT|nr:putative Mra1-like protein [Encephalitozoon intestinalis ATCC 50506]ADM10898.1 putative Mra1-like protein [Encephalitozoon intestinalis ATCC 50506]UTX44530.1 ribosomal RNA small subunit methyltransferase NEP1 [Encephalitozoon intestinalis]
MNAPITVVLKGVRPTCESNEENPEFERFYRVLKLLMDSPLNKSKKLCVYIHTTRNVLIELSYLLEVPENPIELSDVMSYLLKRLVVKSSDGTVLAKVIKNPINNHLPPNSTKIRLSPRGSRVSLKDLESHIERGLAFFVGVGADEKKEGEFDMKLSNFKLSPENCCAKLTSILEEMLGIF